MRRFWPFLLTLLVFAGCGNQVASSAQPTAISMTATPTTPSVKIASQVIAAMKASGLPIGSVVVYDAITDPNHLLGRPSQYTERVGFADTRYTPTSVNVDSSDNGATIEAFATASDAQKRFTYIQAISTSSALFTEYEYIQGTMILRIAKAFTPDQSQMYQEAFIKAVG